MPRIRTIKPEFWADEKLSPLDPTTRLVFIGMISMADDCGRLVDNLKQIDAFIFPETKDSANDSLSKLADLGRIVRGISASGQRIIQITNWSTHQKIDHPNLRCALPEIIENNSRELFENDSREIPDKVATLSVPVPKPVPEPKPIPPTPQGGKRRSRNEILTVFSEPTKLVVNELIDMWPHTRPGNHSPIKIDLSLLAERVDEVLKVPSMTDQLALGAARRYLAEKKEYLHAPEFFFGPGKNGEPPWKPYARMEYHEQHKQLTLAVAAGATQ